MADGTSFYDESTKDSINMTANWFFLASYCLGSPRTCWKIEKLKKSYVKKIESGQISFTIEDPLGTYKKFDLSTYPDRSKYQTDKEGWIKYNITIEKRSP